MRAVARIGRKPNHARRFQGFDLGEDAPYLMLIVRHSLIVAGRLGTGFGTIVADLLCKKPRLPNKPREPVYQFELAFACLFLILHSSLQKFQHR